MRLESFSVENFRSITKARKISLGQSTVLVGPNNEGKSNILRALNIAMSALTDYSRTSGPVRRLGVPIPSRSGTYNWKRDCPVAMQGSRTEKKTCVTLEFSLTPEEVVEFREEINSNLNCTLPVIVTFGRNDIDIKISKQGPGSGHLNQRSARVAMFLAKRIQFQYIPAVRTAQQASTIVQNLIANELRAIERDAAYQEAVAAIKELQKPVLESISKRMTDTLRAFLPDMKEVTFAVADEDRYSALRRSVNITVDDGVVTGLEAKGDGVQSLVALGLRRHILEESRARRAYILAVEEPEAHLHSDAIYALRDVLNDLAAVDQIVMTTHSGLLANRANVASNVVVKKSTAAPARSLSDIRTALGIRSHDNLVNAELVLLVEGDDDKLAIRAILEKKSQLLAAALEEGRLFIDSLDGAGSLGAKIGLYRGILCNVHCFVDDDQSGRSAIEKATAAGLIEQIDVNTTFLVGKAESEFEDLVRPELYEASVLDRFGVDLDTCKARNRGAKWSLRMDDSFGQAGKRMDDITKQRLKFLIAEAVAGDPDNAIVDHARQIIASLVETLERKLAS